MNNIRLTVNGTERSAEVESRTTLLTWLREQLALTGTKRGCEEGECGACAVLLDGALVDSCLVLAVEAAGRNVITVEGLGDPAHLSPIQQAFSDQGASQCGFCMPGMLIAATALLEANSDPGEAAIREAISANLCRCTGYTRIVEAVRAAARLKRSGR
jgi:carbon-monoxide dehydrogenase small subunit